MKAVIRFLGFIALLVGVVWIAQGTGHFPYPPHSFMLNQMPWAYRGAVLAIVGLAVILITRQRRA